MDLIQNYFLKTVNMFGYAQVTSPYGSGEYLRFLDEIARKEEDLILARIDSEEDILDSIKTFLGKGK